MRNVNEKSSLSAEVFRPRQSEKKAGDGAYCFLRRMSCGRRTKFYGYVGVQADKMLINLSFADLTFFLGLYVSIASAVRSPTLTPSINPFIAHLLYGSMRR